MEEKYTKDEAKYLKTGFYAALVLICIVGAFVWKNKAMQKSDGNGYYSVIARFGRTDGLMIGGKVRLAGVDIGTVTAAKFDDKFHAILTLKIKDSVKIPDDSSASIVSSSIMGAKYIEVEPGGSEEFISTNGEFSYTQDALVLEELIDRIISIGKANRSPKSLEKLKEFENNV